MRYAVYLNEVPEDIRKKYKLIGRGQTALVFKKDNDTVLLVTRDPMKVEWLTQPWGLQLGKVVKELESTAHPLGRSHPLYVIEMPYLRPLSSSNKSKVRKELKRFQKAVLDLGINYGQQDFWERIYEYYNENYPDSILLPFFEFMLNYSGMGTPDLRLANFAEDRRGNIVILDPVVSKEVVEFIHRLVRAMVLAQQNDKTEPTDAGSGTLTLQEHPIPEPLKKLMADMGISEEEVVQRAEQRKKSLMVLQDMLSPILNPEQLYRSAVTDLLTAKAPGKVAPEAVAYDDYTLAKLLRLLRTENPAYAVLRSPFCGDRVPPAIEVVSDPNHKVPTAAMDGFGKVTLNTSFVQAVLNVISYERKYGDLDLGPRASVLESNDIPPEYVAVEFILRHEFKHYIRGDLTMLYLVYKTKAKKHPAWFTASNIAEDLLINYEASKQMGLDPGNPLLPIGMFTTSHTYENGWTTGKLIEEVFERLKKLPQQKQQKQQGGGDSCEDGSCQQQQDQQSGGGGQSQSGEQQQDQQSEGGGQSQSGEQQQDQQSGGGGQQQDQQPDEQQQEGGGGSGVTLDDVQNEVEAGDSTHRPDNVEKGDRASANGEVPDPDKDPEAAEKAADEAEDKISQIEEEAQKEGKTVEEQASGQTAQRRGKQGGKRSKSKKGDSGIASDLDEVIELSGELKPDLSWQELIRHFAGFVRQAKVEETYTRPSVTRVGVTYRSLQEKGVGVVFPAVKLLEEEEKAALVLYFDTSGSMGNILPGQMNHIRKVLSTLKLNKVWLVLMGRPMEVGIFEPRRRKDEVQHFKIVKRGNEDVKVEKLGTLKFEKFLKRASLGGTEISFDVVKWLSKHVKARKVGVILFTDTDLLAPANLKVVNEVVRLTKGKTGAVVPVSEYPTFVNKEGLKINRKYITVLKRAED